MDKKKILIIDDEKGFTDLIKSVLEDTGKYTAIAENDGKKGLDTAMAVLPDLILMDLMMPVFDGPYVAQRLKDNEATKDIPIIFLTGAITPDEEKSRGGVIGGHPFIAKPVPLKTLLIAVEKNLKD